MTLTIAVTGATGQQGKAVINSLIEAQNSNGINIVAVSRDISKDSAQQLTSLKNVSLKQADFNDLTSLEEAFKNCDALFAVTNFWEIFDANKEYQQAVNMFDAAEKCNVGHVVFSTLEDTRENEFKTSNDVIPFATDEFKVPHFDGKGKANEYGKSKKFTMTSLYTSFFYENFTSVMKCRPNPEGTARMFCVPMKDKPLPMVAIADIGKIAAKHLLNKTDGSVGAASCIKTGQEIAAILSEATGQVFAYYAMPADDYRKLGFPGAVDLGNMFQVKEVHNDAFCKMRTVREGRKDFKKWCEENKEGIL